jgi:hypothetical protein
MTDKCPCVCHGGDGPHACACPCRVRDAQPVGQGRKDDAGKLEWSLLPKGSSHAVIRVLMFGAKKYGRENWIQVPEARQRYYDALMRHMDAWWQDPKSKDADTGESHLAHAICCAMFLLYLDTNGGCT